MKRRFFTICILLLPVCLLFLQDCRHDAALSNGGSGGPDSLYVGRPYVMPNISSARYQYRAIISPANNPMTYEGVQLGRMLFYDSTLSLNHLISCAHCHKQQYAFGDNQKLSQNVLASTVRNTPPLANLGMNYTYINMGTQISSFYFWDGRQSTIEDAVNDAFNHEMRPDFTAVIRYLSSTPQYAYLFKKAFGRPGDVTEAKVAMAIAQFIRTMVSVNSRIDQYYRGEIELSTAEYAGLDSMLSNSGGDCYHCHVDAEYLTFAIQQPSIRFANNAIDSESSVWGFKDLGRGAIDGDSMDNGKFKVPTLRNCAVTGPYMHDGRYSSLQEVIGHYSDSLKHSPNVTVVGMTKLAQGGLHLDAQGKANLLAFLNALTDTAFLHNPALSNPFH